MEDENGPARHAQLRQLYLESLYGLLRHSPYRTHPHKSAEILRMLHTILNDDRYDGGSQEFASMIVLEFEPLLKSL